MSSSCLPVEDEPLTTQPAGAETVQEKKRGRVEITCLFSTGGGVVGQIVRLIRQQV